VNVNRYATYLVGRSEIIVYLWDTEEQRILAADPNAEVGDAVTPVNPDSIKAAIDQMSNIKEYEYISKEQALAEVGEMMEEYKNLLADYQNGVRENPVPANFRIKVDNLSEIEQTALSLQALPGVQKVTSPNDLAIILLSVKSAVNYAGWGLVAVLALVGLVIVSNTIRLTVFARRKEINIMKFVGATNTFIRMPFFVEGMAVGFIAAIIAFSLLSGGYVGLITLLTENLAGTTNTWLSSVVPCIMPFGEVWYYMLGIFSASGIVMGGLGSALSIHNHLKV
ncbi:MAG: permease-like cell division protein FtsX, partial [Oscillospiraceae bacterium]